MAMHSTTCPGCGVVLQVPDDILGKRIRCTSCQTMFVAARDKASSAAVVREEDHEAIPTVERAAPARRAPARVKKNKPVRIEKEEQDETEEDEDRQSFADAPPPSSGGSGGLIFGAVGIGVLAVVGLLCCGGVGVGAALFWPSNSPT